MQANKPRIVLNMTTLNQGGVLQRAVSFINHLDTVLNDFDWHLLLSETVDFQLKATNTNTSKPITVFETSPAKNTRSRAEITAEIKEVNPQMVFTFAGPSYLRQPFPELMGIADGWVTHADKQAFGSIPNLRNRWGLRFASFYKLKWFATASHYTVQTEFARQGLATRAKVDLSKIHIIPNALANWYREIESHPTELEVGQTLKILYFAAAYSHKRHDILPQVCLELEKLGLDNFEFVITLPTDNAITKAVETKAKDLGVTQRIRNMGPLPVIEGVRLYQECHVCFVPTALETFSATYLEGMATQTPIVTSDRNFATEICGEGALYFELANPRAAAERIFDIVNNEDIRKQLTTRGSKQLETFPNVAEQMQLYKQTLSKLLASEDFPPA